MLDLSEAHGHTLVVVTHDLNMANRFPHCLNIQDINEVRREASPEQRITRGKREEVTI
ncbi:hypothetical protein D3C81_2117070 [compost metagenome]